MPGGFTVGDFPPRFGLMNITPSDPSLRYHEARPPASIADWVEAIWWTEGDAGAGGFRHDVLPDGCADWIVSARDGKVASIFVGPMSKAATVLLQPGERCFGLRFRPGALGRVARQPLDEMLDATVDPAVLPLAGSTRLTSAFAAGAPATALIVQAEQLLRPWHRLAGVQEEPDKTRVVRAAGLLAARHEDMTVAQIAAHTGMSVRTLRRVFASDVGLAPKAFARVMRMQALLKTLTRRRFATPDWAGLAAAHGFADQAHLVRECRALTGWTPAAFRAGLENGRFLQYQPRSRPLE